MEPILEMQHITYSYHTTEGETKALEDVSFSVSEGEFIAIVGPSGCGKSTLLSIICGILKPEKGVIKMNGKNLKQSITFSLCIFFYGRMSALDGISLSCIKSL